jgi:glutathione synthase/RimK-type ligase-like ATP-grasp enzyme
MILLCGIPSESPLCMVRDALAELRLPYVFFNQRRFAETDFVYEIRDNQIVGTLTIENEVYDLEDFTGVYTRLMDDQALPEIKKLPADSPLRAHSRNTHDALFQWLEIAPARVVNRAAAMSSNSSKPFQAQLIARHGFSVPKTLITNDPATAREFYSQHRRVVYKSISSVRSIVQTLTDEDFRRMERIRWCPTQFQEFVEGTNVRVHVVGKQVFATAVETEATDYRYAHKQNSEADLRAVELEDDLAEKCVQLAAALDLAFAGIDLKITPEREIYCFEVNPSPGFSYFETNTEQPIAESVAKYLAGISD